MRIAIVGGSLSGLFVAVLMRQADHEVTLFERSSTGLEGRARDWLGRGTCLPSFGPLAASTWREWA